MTFFFKMSTEHGGNYKGAGGKDLKEILRHELYVYINHIKMLKFSWLKMHVAHPLHNIKLRRNGTIYRDTSSHYRDIIELNLRHF